jgi:hypothetical protein
MLDLKLHLRFAVRRKYYMYLPLSLILISMSSRFLGGDEFPSRGEAIIRLRSYVL